MKMGGSGEGGGKWVNEGGEGGEREKRKGGGMR